MGGFERIGGTPDSEPSFDPEVLRQTTIRRAMRAAERTYGAGNLVHVGEDTDEADNLKAVLFAPLEQSKDSSLPKKVIKMKWTEKDGWQSEELTPD